MYRRLSAGSTITVKNGMDVVKNIKKMFNSPPKRARAHRRS